MWLEFSLLKFYHERKLTVMTQKQDSDQEELENCVPYHKEDYGACLMSLRSWKKLQNLSFEKARN